MANFTAQEVDVPFDQGSYTVSVGVEIGAACPPIPPPPVVDTTPPVADNFVPPSGTPIARTQSIQFDVTDDSGLFARIFVVAFFKTTGIQEVIHDGTGFVGFYAASSSRVVIANGFRYTVLRSGGWTEAPTIRVFPIDAAGNE